MRFLCTRQFQNKISESVYTLLKFQIERFKLEAQFEIFRDRIVNRVTGAEFIFYGLWRHIDEIKSLEGIDICWVEEAHNLTEAQWNILEPTVRGEGSQFWLIFNPILVTDFVWRRFVQSPPPKTIVRKINYTDNPFLSQTILDVIGAKKDEDEEGYRHTYLGEPREDDDRVIIKRSWIQAAIDAHKTLGIEPSGRRRIGFDVADSGDDKNAWVETHGIVVTGLDEWKGGEDQLLQSASRVHKRAVLSGAEIDYDSIGIGAFAGSHFKALNEQKAADNTEFAPIAYYKFNAGGSVINPDAQIDPKNPKSQTNKDFYANLKAQAWWEVGRRFLNTYNAIERGMKFDEAELISIASDVPQLEGLITELSTPRKDFDTAGKSKVESKKDLLKRDVPSPNKADAFVMANAPREKQSVGHEVEITGFY